MHGGSRIGAAQVGEAGAGHQAVGGVGMRERRQQALLVDERLVINQRVAKP